MRLTDSEVRALRWLGAEFPIGNSWENKMVEWSFIVSGLSRAAGVDGDAASDQVTRRLKALNLFESHRMPGNMFRGAITAYGEQVLREASAVEEANQQAGGPLKRLGRYIVAQGGPIVLQALIGAAIGLVGGVLAGSVASAVPTGIAAATLAGRVPDVRRR